MCNSGDYADDTARMEHVTIWLPSDLVEELRSEGDAMGCGTSWAVRRRLEAGRETGSRQSQPPKVNEPHGGGKLQAQTEGEG